MGEHVAEYINYLVEEDHEAYERQFANYIKVSSDVLPSLPPSVALLHAMRQVFVARELPISVRFIFLLNHHEEKRKKSFHTFSPLSLSLPPSSSFFIARCLWRRLRGGAGEGPRRYPRGPHRWRQGGVERRPRQVQAPDQSKKEQGREGGREGKCGDGTD